ncbi:MAG: ABC transporter substrate-binding protein [Clostridia bacterium]|nr:ABC transporter substrate-binding protein [Clostridia bacterium]
MKKAMRILALVLAVVMALALVACTGKPIGENTPAPTETTKPGNETTAPTESDTPVEPTKEPRVAEDKTLVVGYSPFSSKFSPFFAQTAYDQDVQGMTQIGLLTSDRTGAIITKGIEGETINFNGTDYTYYGPADLEITENADGTVYYDFTMRDDITFSDGEPVTIDDAIFTMYVLCDPTYDGSSTLFAQPILGMEEYRSGMENLLDLLIKAGRENTDFEHWDEETQTKFWNSVETAGPAWAEKLGEEIYAKYGEAYADSFPNGGTPAECFQFWNFDVADDATYEDCWQALKDTYGDDLTSMQGEAVSTTLWDMMEDYNDYLLGVQTGESADHIEGIQKTGDYSMRVVLTEVDATAIYQLGVTLAPMHYYGEKEKYDYDNNKFGFDKGDLGHVRSVTTKPMGAGPYKYIKFEQGVVNFEANETYFLGCPYTKYVNFLETLNDGDKLNGIVTGTCDISDPTFSTDNIKQIEDYNGGSLTGPVITTNTVDNLGYGYIGINAIRMSVGGDAGSDASKNLRRAFATIYSVYRDVAIDSYYGDRASVINYPISNTSWAAPRPADDGYQIAFSTDVNGDPIYTSGMTAEEKYAAALQAALGFFEAAGYTVEDGKLTAAPEGAALEYKFWIPADGIGDHPSFMILNESNKALATIGMNLIINDLSNSADLWDNLDANQVDMWAAAWGATVDPDMYQIYYSDAANGPIGATSKKNANGGPAQGGSSYMYCIADPELDQLILAARQSTDQNYRKQMYKACLDKVIDWACEVPVYQRQNAILFSTERVNLDTVTPDITTFYGWMAELQNLKMN